MAVVPNAMAKAEAATFVMGLEHAGVVSLAFMIIVVVGGWVLKKFKSEGKGLDAQGSLYDNMSDRIAKLEGVIEKMAIERDKVSGEKDAYLKEASEWKARVMILEGHEKENLALRQKLDEKDDKLSDLEAAAEIMKAEIDELKAQIMTLTRRQMDKCDNCVNRSILEKIAPDQVIK